MIPYDTKERTLASFINGALLPFFCHLYSHDDWYKVLNDDISLPTIFLLTHIGQSIVVPYLRENQAAFAPQTNRPMLYRGLNVRRQDGVPPKGSYGKEGKGAEGGVY